MLLLTVAFAQLALADTVDVDIATDTPGATVYVRFDLLGEAPGVVTVPEGKRLKIVHPNGQLARIVTVPPATGTDPIPLLVNFTKVSFTIDGPTPGCSIWIEDKGTTVEMPADYEVWAGPYTAHMTCPGEQVVTRTLEITADTQHVVIEPDEPQTKKKKKKKKKR